MKYLLAILTLLSLLAFTSTATVLWTEIMGKPAVFPPSAHDHDDRYYTKSMQNRSFLPSSYKPDWMVLLNRPATFPAAPHTHNSLYYTKARSDSSYLPVTYVPTWVTITGKPSTFNPAAHDHNDLYFTKSQSNAAYLPATYLPDWSIVTGKPATYPATAHVHDDRYYLKTQSDANYLPSSYLPAWANLTGKPATFAPSSHTHTTGDMPGMGALLAGYITTSDARLTDARTPISHTHTAAQIVDFAQALNTNITSSTLAQGTLIRAGSVKVFCAPGATNAAGELTINLTMDNTLTGTPIFSKVLANWSNATVATINLPNDVVTGCVRSESLIATTHHFITGRTVVGTLLNSYANAPTGTPVRITLIGI